MTKPTTKRWGKYFGKILSFEVKSREVIRSCVQTATACGQGTFYLMLTKYSVPQNRCTCWVQHMAARFLGVWTLCLLPCVWKLVLNVFSPQKYNSSVIYIVQIRKINVFAKISLSNDLPQMTSELDPRFSRESVVCDLDIFDVLGAFGNTWTWITDAIGKSNCSCLVCWQGFYFGTPLWGDYCSQMNFHNHTLKATPKRVTRRQVSGCRFQVLPTQVSCRLAPNYRWVPVDSNMDNSNSWINWRIFLLNLHTSHIANPNENQNHSVQLFRINREVPVHKTLDVFSEIF